METFAPVGGIYYCYYYLYVSDQKLFGFVIALSDGEARPDDVCDPLTTPIATTPRPPAPNSPQSRRPSATSAFAFLHLDINLYNYY